jgi:hypothetical protein
MTSLRAPNDQGAWLIWRLPEQAVDFNAHNKGSLSTIFLSWFCRIEPESLWSASVVAFWVFLSNALKSLQRVDYFVLEWYIVCSDRETVARKT